MTTQDKLTALRGLMQKEGLSAYIVPSTDPHASEYMASHWAEVHWLTSFTGEAGTAVVTMDQALLWTDSRYYLQAGIQLEGTTVSLMRESDIDCPKIADWLIQHGVSNGGVVGVNPEMWSVNEYKKLKEQLAEAGIGLKSVDLIRLLWTTDRPAIPTHRFFEFDTRYAGESVHSKMERMRSKMREKKADAMVVSALDEIAWVLNIRGNDVEYNPVVISYLVLEQEKCTLFVGNEKVTREVSAYLRANDIDIRGYNEVFGYLSGLECTILYDGAKVNEALYEAISTAAKTVNAQSPIQIAKSH
jgi:Xaa-Pro aminopeptidase